MDVRNIAFMGLGEAACAIIDGWNGSVPRISAYDIKSLATETAAEIQGRATKRDVTVHPSMGSVLKTADIVFSTVTADQAVIAAETAARDIRQGTWWCDLNSCSPGSKRQAAAVLEAKGARYVDVAVMAPVHPKRHKVPLLLSGPHAAEAEALLQALDMAPSVVEGPVGAASSTKMVRSVMIKGLEALTAECALAAHAAGVADDVFSSLSKSDGGRDWAAKASYNFERSMVHGDRRAAEMEEVTRTLQELGLPHEMSSSAITWQRRLASQGDALPGTAVSLPLEELADLLVQKLTVGTGS